MHNEQNVLVEKIQLENCERSMRMLLFQYEPLFNKLTSDALKIYNRTPLEREDILNVLKANFTKLIKEFDASRGMSLPSYLQTYLRFGISTYLREFSKNKHKIMNYCVEFFESELVKVNDQNNYHVINLDNQAVAQNEIEEIFLNSGLNEIELLIMKEISLNNKTIVEISKLTGRTTKNIYYIKNKAINKIKMNLKKNSK